MPCLLLAGTRTTLATWLDVWSSVGLACALLEHLLSETMLVCINGLGEAACAGAGAATVKAEVAEASAPLPPAAAEVQEAKPPPPPPEAVAPPSVASQEVEPEADGSRHDRHRDRDRYDWHLLGPLQRGSWSRLLV